MDELKKYSKKTFENIKHFKDDDIEIMQPKQFAKLRLFFIRMLRIWCLRL